MNKKVSYCFSLFVIMLLLVMSSCNPDPATKGAEVDLTKPFTVVSHLPSDPEGLNPITSTTTHSRSVTNQLFSNLVHYDVQTLKASPVLIKEMPRIEKISDGEYPLASHYEIHDEAEWDNGQPITGYDVAFSLKVMLNPKVPADLLRPFVERLKHIVIDENNPKKFTVYSDDYILVNEIFTNFPILPEYAYDSKGLLKEIQVKDLSSEEGRNSLSKKDNKLQDFATNFISAKYSRENIVGSGPYKLEEWVTGQRLVLKKKENWWGDKLSNKYPLLKAYPTEIIFRPIDDQTTAVTELKGGKIDVMGGISPKHFDDLKKSDAAKELLNLHTISEYIYYYIGMNRRNQKLADKNVRRAIAHLVDIDEIIEVVMYGNALRTIGPFHPTKEYYNKTLPLIDLNIEKARQLLSEAGWNDSNNNGIVDKVVNGKRIEMELEFKTSKGTGEKIGNLMKANAKKAGVNINLTIKDRNAVRKDLIERKYDLTLSGWSQDPSLDDPKQIWHTSSDTPSGSNRVGFGNAESDKVIETIQTSHVKEERNKLYKKIQELIYEDQPYVFLFFVGGSGAINKKFDAKPSPRKPNIFENQFRLSKGEISAN